MAAPQISRPCILIVEDEAEVRDVLAEALDHLGYDVWKAETAAAAVKIAARERPDAILLDIALPDAAGTTTLDGLRRLRPDVPVIMVTANADEVLARETLGRGAFDYLMKPFNIERLAEVLEVALANSGA
jgi:DNA-binding response OmpR family regulator